MTTGFPRARGARSFRDLFFGFRGPAREVSSGVRLPVLGNERASERTRAMSKRQTLAIEAPRKRPYR